MTQGDPDRTQRLMREAQKALDLTRDIRNGGEDRTLGSPTTCKKSAAFKPGHTVLAIAAFYKCPLRLTVKGILETGIGVYVLADRTLLGTQSDFGRDRGLEGKWICVDDLSGMREYAFNGNPYGTWSYFREGTALDGSRATFSRADNREWPNLFWNTVYTASTDREFKALEGWMRTHGFGNQRLASEDVSKSGEKGSGLEATERDSRSLTTKATRKKVRRLRSKPHVSLIIEAAQAVLDELRRKPKELESLKTRGRYSADKLASRLDDVKTREQHNLNGTGFSHDTMRREISKAMRASLLTLPK